MKYNLIIVFVVLLGLLNFSNATDPIECDFCQLAVDTIESVIKTDGDNYTQVYDAVERLCGSIPSNYTNLCFTFLKYSAPVIINQMMNQTVSKNICEEIEICTPNNLDFTFNHHLCYIYRIHKALPSDLLLKCDSSICKTIVQTQNSIKLQLSQFDLGELDSKCNNI
ncbi:hypothetical protein DLAC_08760 [Tieghemostelium lacteum]|uniref:Saposin B-type domain-containing protein n=1 Tax=Tieghemostelium lacteum TaxID=361077 RepID=A0A151Z873_TIELA|nr:hypothetical protein DLAC_08760 [Tieghemostelium lacteum]|eukprot:KYQ90169.1 hypothetical protein DLAC_08760 [Tieghemostelium lacteum]